MTKIWVWIAMLPVLVGCQSAEERCNAAKVEAYDAWDAWAQQTRADQRGFEDTCAPERGRPPIQAYPGAPSFDPFVGCVAREFLLHNNPPAYDEIEHVRDRARGGAIPFRDGVRALRDQHADHPETLATAVAQRAFAAADTHWVQCSSVSP